MRVILAYVASLDGRVTGPHGEPSREWASPEDQTFFSHLVQEIGTVIMGRNTYEEHKHLFSHTPHVRRIVLSRRDAPSEKVPGVTFSSDSPAALIERLAQEGLSSVLLAAGPHLSNIFLKEELVSDLYVTIEPVIFGSGLSMFSDEAAQTNLELIEQKTLNPRGSILLKYKVRV